MESAVSIPFRHGFVTHLSPISQQWSDSSQELSAKLQSTAETGNIAVVIETEGTEATSMNPCAAGPQGTTYDLRTYGQREIFKTAFSRFLDTMALPGHDFHHADSKHC